MAIDYAEKEREFIESLEADTGRNLEGWMAAIRAEGLPHRNDIIDWLRRQRFTFAKASWLERIHHNGGRPIYAEKPDIRALASEAFDPPPRAGRTPPPPAAAPPTEPTPAREREPAPPPPPAAQLPASASAADIEAVLARGKAYGPLARHLMRVVVAAQPGTVTGVRDGLVTLSDPREFAVIAPSARDVRLGLPGDGKVPRQGIERARLPGAGPAMAEMIVLTDARQIDDVLLGVIRSARDKVNSP